MIMKGLSIEQKAKAYDKALERAKSMIEDLRKGEDILAVSDLESMFPELRESEDERIRKALIDYFDEANKVEENPLELYGIHTDKVLTWLEKQGEQEQLYIRFGEIPTDEKSKIFQGEIEIGTENGVSVYPAFKTSEGDVVLGLSLPITKTTLYTQQHLIEYDDRPCYLVKGDYIGKDTDGQPLINNVSIIEKIDTYRAKEKKQDGQKPTDTADPKFKVGDWVVYNRNDSSIEILYVYDIRDGRYYFNDNIHFSWSVKECDEKCHLWTIQDAKDGDVLAEDSCVFIIKKLNHDLTAKTYCCLHDDGDFELGSILGFDDTSTYPATKEQRDTLEKAMADEGYIFDFEKKELKEIEQNPTQEIKPFEAEHGKYYYCIKDYFCGGKKQASKGDVVQALRGLAIMGLKDASEYFLPVNSVKCNSAWSEEDERNLKGIIDEIEANKNNAPDYDLATYDRFLSWLKSLKNRYTWKPSDEQMDALCYVYQHYTPNVTDRLAWNSIKTLELMYQDLKKLKENKV